MSFGGFPPNSVNLCIEVRKQNEMKRVFMYLWQLPQNILGLILLLYFRRFSQSRNWMEGDVSVFVCDAMRGGVSLGCYIFLDRFFAELDGETLSHELGHCKQSKMLGWLYLPVVGLPSIIHASFYKYDPANPNGYYDFWTEAWADKIGGVKRE